MDRWRWDLKRLRERPDAWEREVRELFDLDPLFYEYELEKEGYGDATPFLLPAEPGPPRPSREERWAGIVDAHAADMRRRLERLAEARPDEGAALASRWETWWGENEPKMR